TLFRSRRRGDLRGARPHARPPAVSRRQERIIALLALYQWDITGGDLTAILERALAEAGVGRADGFSAELVAGIARHKQELDDHVTRLAVDRPGGRIGVIHRDIPAAGPQNINQPHHRHDHVARLAVDWRVERMAVIDRNILRLAAYEIIHRHDVPVSVAINEAVELAKTFSTPEAARFINGILGQLAREQRDPAPRV